jgi:acyl-CoA synthetase (AMP-forming)/AMP-acid ligase II
MAMGATHIVLPGFDSAAVIEAIARYRVTHFFLPPTALYRLLAYPGVKSGRYDSLRYFVCGGAPMSADRLREALQVFGPGITVGYGGTEFGTCTCRLPGAELLRALEKGNTRRLLSCGLPSPLARVEIMDEHGVFLRAEAAGEIVIRSHSVATGYYKNPRETAEAFQDGWLHTGDIGFKDADGWLYISDRKKDMIVSGGLNIYPSEIENVLMAHAAVQDCAVIGVPDEQWGEAVKAVIELKPGFSVNEAQLAAACRAVLAGYKVPKSIEFWPEIPRSPVGKVLKRVIRDRFWQGQTRAV